MTEIHQQFLDYQPTLEAALGESVSVSGLTGPLRIFQRLGGHRHSIDDTTTAWYALQKCPATDAVLDLGTGIGTVGLIVLWGLPPNASLTCIEAQDVSFKLLQANIACNALTSRVKPIHGDLRELHLERKFNLITGSPPYFPRHAGVLPADSQKAHARFELRGDVGDYARAAKRHLSNEGVFVFCFPFQQKRRCIDLVRAAGLRLLTVRDVIPSPTKPALFSLYAASLDRPETPYSGLVEEPPFMVTDATGRYTPEMEILQRSRGFGPDGTNVID